MVTDPPYSYLVFAGVMLVIATRLGPRPFIILYRRLTGSVSMRPMGAERWFVAGWVLAVIGGFFVLVVEWRGGYASVTLAGICLVVFGVQVAMDYNGQARQLVRRAWVESGLPVPPAPLLQARIIGGGAALIGFAWANAGLVATFQ